MALHDGREDLSFEGVEDPRIAEKAGYVDQHVLVKGLDLGGIGLKVSQVFFNSFDFVNDHPALNAAEDGGLAVVCEVHAGSSSEKLEHKAHTGVFRKSDFGGLVAHEIGVTCDAGKLAGNGFRREDVVDTAGRDRASRHAVVFCRLVILGEGDAAVSLDLGQTSGSIGS